jgi:hypothetical protein
MNEKSPERALRESTGSRVETAPEPRVPIIEWAKRNALQTLQQHIESSKEADANLGIFVENVTYNPENKTIEIRIPVEHFHRGHEFGGKDISIVLGGMFSAWADVSSGALAFTQMSPDEVPLHTEYSAKNGAMGILNSKPMRVRSSFIDRESEKAGFCYIRTEVMQGANLCFVHECEVQTVKEKTAERIATMTRNKVGSD